MKPLPVFQPQQPTPPPPATGGTPQCETEVEARRRVLPATYHLHRGELDAAADWIANAIE